MEKVTYCPHCGKAMRVAFDADNTSPGDVLQRRCPYCKGVVECTVDFEDVAKISTDYRCPKCGSENIQAFRLIHLSGTSDFSAVSTGVGIIGDSAASGVAVTSGTSQTRLAAHVSPPEPEHMGLPFLIVIGVGLSVILGVSMVVENVLWKMSSARALNITAADVFLFLVILGISVLIIVAFTTLLKARYNYNTKVFPKEYRMWLQSYVCLRCGGIFIVNKS